MGFLNRLFGRQPAEHEAAAVDRARGQELANDETGQTSGERATTRDQLPAEVDAHRQQRAHALQDDA